MAKVIGIVTDTSYDNEADKIIIGVAVAVRPIGIDINTSHGGRFESYVPVLGTENAQQLNTVVANKIQADVLSKFGLSVQLTDITVTKFS